MATPLIVVIGSANADRIIQLPHLPARGVTVTDGRFMQTFGGKGANQAVAAARAGSAVTFLVSLGIDAEGDAMLAAFRHDNIDVSHALRAVDARLRGTGRRPRALQLCARPVARRPGLHAYVLAGRQ